MGIFDLVFLNEITNCKESILALGKWPWGAIFLSYTLDVSVSEVNTNEIASNIVLPVTWGNVLAFLAYEHSQFYFMMDFILSS